MSSSRLAPTLCAATLLVTLAGSIAAQAVPSTTLSKPTAKSKYTLGNLYSLQELPDGRVIASDMKENVFRLVNLSSGDVGVVGKQGEDADSYRGASLVLKLPGDSLGLYDPAGRKLLHVTPTGSVDRFVPLPTMSNNRRIGVPLAMDQNGAIYFTIGEKFDTVTKALSGIGGLTRLAPGADADEPQMTYHTRRADQTMLKGRTAYIFKDAIAVRADGLMARVVADSYQVVWGRNGKEVGHTGPIPYTPIMLTADEIKATKDSANEAFKTMMSNGGRSGGPGNATTTSWGGGMAGGGEGRIFVMGGGGGGGGGGAPVVMSGGGGDLTMVKRAVEGAAANGGGNTTVMNGPGMNPADVPWADFPEAKPPIPSFGNVAMFDVAGNLWVARNGKVGDPVPHYDVIAEGKGLIAKVDLPKGTRLLGFGKNSVYVARNDEGSDWLERYAMPKLQ